MEQINTGTIENSTPPEQSDTQQSDTQQSDTEQAKTPEKVLWYIKSGSLKGTSEQEDDGLQGLFLATWDLLRKEPWAVLGDFIYGSKTSFDSEKPYVVLTAIFGGFIQQYLQRQKAAQRQEQSDNSQGSDVNKSRFTEITNVVGGIQ
jgi:hypothetical protein